MKKVFLLLIVLGVGAAYYWGKRVPEVSISELLVNSEKYEDTNVSVKGKVVGNAGVLGVGGYKLVAEGAEIFVVSKDGVPQLDSTVTVTGTFHKAFTLGPLEASVIIRSE
jgi:hypothetical protein